MLFEGSEDQLGRSGDDSLGIGIELGSVRDYFTYVWNPADVVHQRVEVVRIDGSLVSLYDRSDLFHTRTLEGDFFALARISPHL